jgi:hypothetical protein
MFRSMVDVDMGGKVGGSARAGRGILTTERTEVTEAQARSRAVIFEHEGREGREGVEDLGADGT